MKFTRRELLKLSLKASAGYSTAFAFCARAGNAFSQKTKDHREAWPEVWTTYSPVKGIEMTA